MWQEGRVAGPGSHTARVATPPANPVRLARLMRLPKNAASSNLAAAQWEFPIVKGHPDPISRFSTIQWTDRPTDRWRESVINIGRYRCISKAAIAVQLIQGHRLLETKPINCVNQVS